MKKTRQSAARELIGRTRIAVRASSLASETPILQPHEKGATGADQARDFDELMRRLSHVHAGSSFSRTERNAR